MIEGLKIAAGIIAGALILFLSTILGMYVGDNGVMFVPHVVMFIIAIGVWFIRRKRPSAFLHGLLISACVGLLLGAACDALVPSLVRHYPGR